MALGCGGRDDGVRVVRGLGTRRGGWGWMCQGGLAGGGWDLELWAVGGPLAGPVGWSFQVVILLKRFVASI